MGGFLPALLYAALAARGGGSEWGKQECTSLDYTVVRGPCDTVTQTRTVRWIKAPRLQAWNCEGPDVMDDEPQGCGCMLDDFEARIVPETNTVESYVIKTDAAGASVCEGGMAPDIQAKLPTGQDIQPCTIADLGFEYSTCDPETQMREVVTYWKEHCAPGHLQTIDVSRMLLKHMDLLITRDDEGVLDLSSEYILIEPGAARQIVREVGPGLAALRNLIGQELLVDLKSYDPRGRTLTVRVDLPPGRPTPCLLECSDGMHLSPPMTRCGFCPKGTHSIRGDIYNNWQEGAENWPESFHTRCYATRPDVRQFECAKWEVRDGMLYSGDQPSNRTVVTILEVVTEIKTQPATLTFTYRMDFDERSVPAMFAVLINSRLIVSYKGAKTPWREETLHIPSSECPTRLEVLPAGAGGNDTASVGACVYRNMFNPSTPAIHFPYVPIFSKDDITRYPFAVIPGDGCDQGDFNLVNATGKLAFVHRDKSRKCSFSTKVLLAQKNGAAAVVVTDFDEQVVIRLSGSSEGISIPFVSMTYAEYERVEPHLKEHADGQIVVGNTPPAPGPAEIQFVVEKSPTPEGTQGGQVFISEVRVEGTKYAAEKCDECPAGMFSTGGVDMPEGCAMCRANTRSSAGADQCVPCPAGHSAPPGSAECTMEAFCAADGFVPVIGECDVTAQGGPKVKVSWVPDGCTVRDVPAPPATVLGCGPGEPMDCMQPGYIRRMDGVHCTACESGMVPSSDSTCKTCAADEYIRFVDMYDGFTRLNDAFAPPAWLATPDGGGEAYGWDFTPLMTKQDGFSVGLQAGASTNQVSASLTHFFSASHSGAVRFEFTSNMTREAAEGKKVRLFYTLARLVDSSSSAEEADTAQKTSQVQYEAEVVLQGAGFDGDAPEDQMQTHEGAETVDFAAGRYALRWEYEKQATDYPAPVLLRSLRVEGSAGGIGVECVACPQGHSCAGGVSTRCPAGTYRGSDDLPVDQCKPCADGTSREGAAACTPCTSGLRSLDLGNGHRVCRSAGCSVEVAPRVAFDITHAATAESYHAAAGRADAFHLNLCEVPAQSPCGSDSLACMTKPAGGTTSYGRSMQLEQVSNAPGQNRRGGGLLVTLTAGDACEADPFRDYMAEVMVVCDPVNRDQYAPQSVMTQLRSEDPCKLEFTVVNPSGCVLCDEAHPPPSFWTPCVNGVQSKKIEWGSCYGVHRGSAGNETQVRSCSTTDIRSWLIPTILGSIAVVSICVFVTYRAVSTHRRLKNKYQALELDQNKDGLQGVQQAGSDLFVFDSPEAGPSTDAALPDPGIE